MLGPFFAVSGLVKDSPGIRRHYLSTLPGAENNEHKEMAETLQQRLSVCRVRVDTIDRHSISGGGGGGIMLCAPVPFFCIGLTE